MWSDNYRGSPSKVVISQPYAGRALRAAELFEMSEVRARRLATIGCVPGCRVALEIGDPSDFLVAHFAVLRLGAISVPVPQGSSDTEVGDVVKDCAPLCVVTDRSDATVWKRTGIQVSTVEGEEAPDLGVTLDVVGPEDVALMLYTSGTTGKPKGVPLSHRNLVSTARSVIAAWEWTDDDSLLLSLPLHHMHGLGVGLHGALCAGGTVVALAKFDTADVVEQVREKRVSMFFGVPTMYAKLLSHADFQVFGRLRVFVSGSAPLSEAAFSRIAEITGREPLERYGMSETGMIASNPYRGSRKAGSVGSPLPGVEIRLSGGSEGEILVRGDAVFAGYWQNEEATRASFTGEGWFRTGDLGTIGDDGFLVINGRIKEVIIKGGQNVFPQEVEACIEEMDGVIEAAVIGEPDEYWGERIVAVVVADRTSVEEELVRQFVASRLSRTKVPDQVKFVPELPRNRLGKIQRGRLKAR